MGAREAGGGWESPRPKESDSFGSPSVLGKSEKETNKATNSGLKRQL